MRWAVVFALCVVACSEEKDIIHDFRITWTIDGEAAATGCARVGADSVQLLVAENFENDCDFENVGHIGKVVMGDAMCAGGEYTFSSVELSTHDGNCMHYTASLRNGASEIDFQEGFRIGGGVSLASVSVDFVTAEPPMPDGGMPDAGAADAAPPDAYMPDGAPSDAGMLDFVYCECVGAPPGSLFTLCVDLPDCMDGMPAPAGTCDVPSACTMGTVSSSAACNTTLCSMP